MSQAKNIKQRSAIPSIGQAKRALIFAFFCMMAGAVVYASQTETIDQCKMLYDDDLLKIGISPK